MNADRKTLYQDLEELQQFGYDIIAERKGRGYYYYLGGNYPLQILINEDIEGSNILIVKDSYACVCAPQLALMCGSVTLWDMRYENDSLFQYLEEHPEIDMVIVMYSSSYVVGRAANDFH